MAQALPSDKDLRPEPATALLRSRETWGRCEEPYKFGAPCLCCFLPYYPSTIATRINTKPMPCVRDEWMTPSQVLMNTLVGG